MAHLPKGKGVIPLPPFQAWLASNIPAVYDNTMTYYEELCALLKYLQDQVVPALNENAETITILSEYVEHYFDNLDVQEEINNKLDEMVESGELQRVINTPASKTNIGGVIVGEGIDVDAEGKISVEGIDSYLPVDVTEYQYTATNPNSATNTLIHYVIIPSDYIPKLVLSDPENVNVVRRASEVAAENKATVMINAGLQRVEGTTDGVVIVNHVLKQNNNVNNAARGFLTITDNGILGSVSGDVSTETIVAGGYKDVVAGWYPLYMNGSDLTDQRDPDDLQPRSFIAQKSNGDYLVGVTSGRTKDDTGMTTQNIIDFLFNVIGFTPSFVYSLDGGGSSNLLYRGIRQNRMTSNEDRACANWIVFTSEKESQDYETQATNNEKMIQNAQLQYPKFYTAADLRSMLTLADGLTIESMSYACKASGIMTLNITFTTTGTSAAYSNLLSGLPVFRGNGNQYCDIVLLANAGADVRNYLGYLYVNNNVQYFRTRFSLPAGTYCLNLSYPCEN